MEFWLFFDFGILYRIISSHIIREQNLMGDNGPRVAGIAEDLNVSAGTIEPLEQRIQDRNAIVRFFAGGDRSAADQITDQVAMNNGRIQNLEQIMQNTTLQPDVQQAMQEQITALQQEQTRLSNLAGTEHNATGLFWWL